MNAITKAPAQDIPRISKQNYISRDFLELEKKRLWRHIWQVACRVEEIPTPGDFLTYDIGDDSLIIVRDRNSEIRAFYNVCPHRGRALTQGCGHANTIRCPYHGWTFDLEGQNILVQDKPDWAGLLDQDEIALRQAKVDTWGGFVFVNMDPACGSLADHLGVIPEYLDPFEYENMRFRWYLQVKAPCNWKVAQEAFMEGYHVAATHTQLLHDGGDDRTQSRAHGIHSHFGYWDSQAPPGMPSPRLKKDGPADIRPTVISFFTRLEDTFRAIITDRGAEAAKGIMEVCPPDVDAMTAFGTAVELGRRAAEADGCGYPPNLDYEKLAKAGTGWHVFPNCVTLPWFDGAVWYRARPDGDNPDSCIFDIWSLKRYGPGQEPKLEREIVNDPAGRSFGLIVDQDMQNMGQVQRGMKSAGLEFVRPNPVQEVEIINFHRALEEHLR